MLRVGDVAPDFTTTDCRGNPVQLSALRGQPVVLFFFPRAFTIACTIEVRAFRDHEALIQERGARLVGVSVDTVQKQCEFAEQEQVQFTLIGDESREISRSYGVLWPLLNRDRRATFLIDERGVVEEIIHHEVKVYRHLDDVLAWLERRASQKGTGKAEMQEGPR